jgi:hypothetical protein
VSKRRIPITATLVMFSMSVVFGLWSSALAVLGALTALAWALAYGVVVTAGFYALLRKKLPARPFSTGRAGLFIFGVAVIWSVILCFAVIWTDPKRVGLGMLGAIIVGVVLYLLIPGSRRGKVVGVTTDAVVIPDK